MGYDKCRMSHIGLVLEFALFAGISWVAGVWLTRITDAIDAKFKLGSAFGGLLILGIVTGLPEMAIVITAALQHHYGIIIGTLVGGIAMQTVVLCIFDARMKVPRPLSFAASSLTLVVEATTVILVTVASIIAIRTPVVIAHSSVSLASALIFGFWLIGLWLAYHARRGLPWRAEAIEATPGRDHHERRAQINHPSLRGASNSKIFSGLVIASLVTLAAGVGLAITGNNIATDYNLSSGLFAATFIALASALPNISTGIASIDIGDYKLAISDIFGNNAFLPALFIVCDLLARHPVLANATSSDIWFAALGVLLTGIYIIGLIVRPRRQYFRMGPDSIAILALYIVGLVAITLVGN